MCVKQLQEQLVATRRQIEGLNRERKLQQTAAGKLACTWGWHLHCLSSAAASSSA